MLHAYPHNKKKIFYGGVRFQITVSIIALILLFLFANQGFRKMVRNRRELHRLEQEIKKLKEENTLLKKELSLSRHDLLYLERVARKELGLIQPGEIEYRFIEETDTTDEHNHDRP